MHAWTCTVILFAWSTCCDTLTPCPANKTHNATTNKLAASSFTTPLVELTERITLADVSCQNLQANVPGLLPYVVVLRT